MCKCWSKLFCCFGCSCDPNFVPRSRVHRASIATHKDEAVLNDDGVSRSSIAPKSQAHTTASAEHTQTDPSPRMNNFTQSSN